MKRQVLSLAFVCAAACAVAAPALDCISFDQNADSRHVTVNYRLSGEPAVVTLTIETNASEGVWLDIGEQHVTRLVGSVNRIVQPGDETKTIMWGPDDDLPDVTLAAGKIRPVLTLWPTNALPDWMSVDPTSATGTRFYASTNAIPGGIGGRLHKTSRLLLRRIRAAGREFLMGAPLDEVGRVKPDNTGWNWTLETPHRVTLTRDYWIGVYPVTQAQWSLVMGNRPAHFSTCEHGDAALHPIENISYASVTSYEKNFLGSLRKGSGIPGFALPTTAEWEYACRAGVRGALYTGEELANATSETDAALDRLAWYKGNSGNRTHAVGQKLPNAWGLYDMLGNVEEWTSDWFRTDLGTAELVDPTEPEKSDRDSYASCGGCWSRPAYRTRCCCRNAYMGGTTVAGFRVICHFGD